MDALWSLNVIDGPAYWGVLIAAVVFAIYLLMRTPTPRWVLTSLLGIVLGVAIALGVFLASNATNAFGSPLPLFVAWWSMGALGGVGLAVANLFRSRWWRKVLAIIGALVFALAGGLGINAAYGLNPTLGSMFGISADNPVTIPTPDPSRTNAGPLYSSWTPPADMPAKGTQGTQVIPATVSGFDARPAGIYLPPAAQVANAPALPLVILMMGYPGNPDPSYIGAVLDDYASKNKGLAPIVVVADQIGNGGDPACADSSTFGNAETYIKKDVVDWAKTNLNILEDPRFWVIAGYSNGGGCAIKYGAQEPDVFKNILDISGEEFPGSEDADSVIAQIYGGDSAKFEASKPINILAANKGKYDGVNAIFTVGGADPAFIPAAKAVSAAAKDAGMTTAYIEIPGAGHVVDGLNGGLDAGFGLLYPILQLSPPGS
ncbi:alpha/beta fold hydrolase [Microbacterium sp. 1P10UB]|uniref:alpha/beta fold hydrolase n=1 Tax=unclassified Microbacterium TaxID=2609290 RepID=UPI0039A28875